MNNDAILLAMSLDELTDIVKETLLSHRNWLKTSDIVPLTRSPLAECSLLTGFLLIDAPRSPTAIHRGLVQLLHWLVETLQPLDSEHSWFGWEWQSYNCLQQYYLDRDTPVFSAVSEKIGVEENLIYNLRDKAVTSLAQRIQLELQNAGQSLAEHRALMLRRTYEACAPLAQTLLRIIVLFETGLPQAALPLLVDNSPTEISTTVQTLRTQSLLIQSKDNPTSLTIHPHFLQYYSSLRLLNTDNEKERWLTKLAQYHTDQRNYLQAVECWWTIKVYRSAAQLLIDHHATLVDNGQLEAMYEWSKRFKPEHLTKEVWGKLKFAIAEVAERVDDIETAAEAYRQVQQWREDDLSLNYEAMLRRAKVLENSDPTRALAQYEEGIARLKEYLELSELLKRLLIQFYIDRSWLYMQERRDPTKAEADLQAAKALLKIDYIAERTKWFDAWARLMELKSEDYALYVEYALQAWYLAEMYHDQDLMMKAAHNVAMGYAFSAQPDQGLTYIAKSLAIAQTQSNQQMIANCHRIYGVCYFFKGDYPQAIDHYQQAYHIFKATKNKSRLGDVCHDLAETYLALNDLEKAKPYFDQAWQLGNDLKEENLIAALNYLAQTNPGLVPQNLSLTDRQQNIYDTLKTAGPLSASEVTDQVTTQFAASFSTRTALRNLNQLAKIGLVERIGQGRGAKWHVKK